MRRVVCVQTIPLLQKSILGEILSLAESPLLQVGSPFLGQVDTLVLKSFCTALHPLILSAVSQNAANV